MEKLRASLANYDLEKPLDKYLLTIEAALPYIIDILQKIRIEGLPSRDPGYNEYAAKILDEGDYSASNICYVMYHSPLREIVGPAQEISKLIGYIEDILRSMEDLECHNMFARSVLRKIAQKTED